MSDSSHPTVMAALDAAIQMRGGVLVQWMAGSSPAMTQQIVSGEAPC